MGLLILHGVLRLDQFWPLGSSDADTSKVKPTRSGNGALEAT